MKMLITSDVHGDLQGLKDVIHRHKDISIHLNAGDMALDPKHYEPFHIITVKGNNDFGVDLPYIRILDIGGIKIMLSHGHLEHVKFSLDKLKLRAKLEGVALVIFGHTHERYLMVENNIMFVNPGALGDYHKSYATYDHGQVTFHTR
jgi:uncharacterized protein